MYKYLKNRNKTNHLSIEENKELMEKYYDGENIEQLIKEYNINISPTSLSSTFQLIKTPEKICKYCKSEMYYIPPSKSAQYKKEYICKNCFHMEGKDNCACQNCLLRKQEQANQKRILSKKKRKESKSKESLILQEHAISIEELSLKERIYLGAILRCNPLSKSTFFTLERSLTNDYAPTIQYAKNIMQTLIERGIIFEIDSNETSIKFAVNIKDLHLDNNILITLMYPNQMEILSEELLEIVRDIQAYESIEYFALTAQKFKLPYFGHDEIEKKFLLLYKQILNNGYSTGQLFNFTYGAIRNVAAKNNCSLQNINLLNKIYIDLSNKYDKAIAENWSVKNYSRTYEQKVSEIFKLVSNDLLGIKEALFYEPLSIM